MKRLLPYYERELATLHDLSREFAEQYPALAGRLGMSEHGDGIDANTQLWEIRASVDPDRNVRCDFLTNNCGTTAARFGGGAIVYFQLYVTTSERGKLADFTMGLVVPLATDPAVSSVP
jgi:hypothetical protein